MRFICSILWWLLMCLSTTIFVFIALIKDYPTVKLPGKWIKNKWVNGSPCWAQWFMLTISVHVTTTEGKRTQKFFLVLELVSWGLDDSTVSLVRIFFMAVRQLPGFYFIFYKGFYYVPLTAPTSGYVNQSSLEQNTGGWDWLHVQVKTQVSLIPLSLSWNYWGVMKVWSDSELVSTDKRRNKDTCMETLTWGQMTQPFK